MLLVTHHSPLGVELGQMGGPWAASGSPEPGYDTPRLAGPPPPPWYPLSSFSGSGMQTGWCDSPAHYGGPLCMIFIFIKL